MTTPETFRELLSIDRTDLDSCLVQQPELYYHVSEAHAQALARHHAAKLVVEEAEAKFYELIRADLVDEKERPTEGLMSRRLSNHPEIQKLQRKLLEARKEVDTLLALKEAFQQRSFMLRELVALIVNQFHQSDTGMDKRPSGRDALAESARQRIAAERKKHRSVADK